MNKAIKKYLISNHPKLNLNSINGKFNLRFELGGEILENGTIERVNQAVSRATEIYKQTIGNGELIVVIQESESEYFEIEKRNKGYLSKLLPLDKLTKFKGPFEQTYYEIDELGNQIEKIAKDKLHCDLLIGKLIIDEESINKIIQGRANLEMGFDPAIPQDLSLIHI